MTIKTAVTLTSGAAVGFLFGMFVEDETKERIASNVRKKIFKWLTGENLPEKKKKYEPYKPYKPTTYATYSKPKNSNDDDKNVIIRCKSKEEVDELIKFIKKTLTEYGSISKLDIYSFMGLHCDYSMDFYGWRDDITDQIRVDDKKVILPKAVCLAGILKTEKRE
jgi:hypothetical protein